MTASSDARHPAFALSRSRRALDVLVGSLALLVAAPVLVVAAVAILLLDGRPLFHRAERMGEGGRPFSLLKLRTMRTGPAGPGVTAADDARITPLGRVLRRLSVDELPQLWSVVRGQMTLVGPRPESVDLARRYPPQCREVLQVRPGLTGPAQLRYREGSATPPAGWDVERWYLEVMVPRRVAADLDFLRGASLLRTVRYLGLTALFVVGLVDLSEPPVTATGTGASSPTTSGSQRALRH